MNFVFGEIIRALEEREKNTAISKMKSLYFSSDIFIAINCIFHI